MALDADFISGVTTIIGQLGSIHSLNSSGVVSNVRGVVTKAQVNNSQLVNSASVEGKVFYCLPLANKPKKFDKLTDAQGEVHVIKDVHDLIVSGVIICHKMSLKA